MFRRTLPLATEFIAQPPASVRSVRPVRSAAYSTRWKNASSYIACTERAMSRWRSSSGSSGLRAARAAASSAGENRSPTFGRAVVPLIGDFLAVMAEVSADRARYVPSGRSRTIWRIASMKCGPAVGREPHHLVLVAVMGKAEILGQRLIEDAERMRKIDAAIDADSVVPSPTPQAALAKSPKPSTETTTASFERRDVERRGQMRHVVLYRVNRSIEYAVGHALP